MTEPSRIQVVIMESDLETRHSGMKTNNMAYMVMVLTPNSTPKGYPIALPVAAPWNTYSRNDQAAAEKVARKVQTLLSDGSWPIRCKEPAWFKGHPEVWPEAPEGDDDE